MLFEQTKEVKKETIKVAEYVAQVFDIYDNDRSGYLSKIEFPPAVNSILGKFNVEPLCSDDIVDIFNLLDVNGDETISR